MRNAKFQIYLPQIWLPVFCIILNDIRFWFILHSDPFSQNTRWFIHNCGKNNRMWQQSHYHNILWQNWFTQFWKGLKMHRSTKHFQIFKKQIMQSYWYVFHHTDIYATSTPRLYKFLKVSWVAYGDNRLLTSNCNRWRCLWLFQKSKHNITSSLIRYFIEVRDIAHFVVYYFRPNNYKQSTDNLLTLNHHFQHSNSF